MIDPTLASQRQSRLFAAMDDAGIDVAAIIPGPNFYFLTGVQFGLMERPTILLVTRTGRKYAIIPLLEKSRWQSSAPEVETAYWQDADGYRDAFRAIAELVGPVRIGVEGQRMRFFEAQALRENFTGATILDAHAAISRMRLHKDADEIAALSKAIAISEAALGATIARAGAGMSETAFRQMLVASMLEHGADGPSFEPIVLAGAASADPHGTPTPDRKLENGQPLLIDYGAAWGGYAADITRTFFVGHATPEHRAVYEAVRAANALGHEIARPGMTMDEYDRRVTQAMKDAGFADLVVHKTGHGLGLEVHEAPQVMVGNMQQMQPGIVFTLEPGLYRDGDIGVRIEDDLVVTETGTRSLTGFPRELTIIG
jgi:Xaa-Pro aminopeptidase